MQNRNRNRLQRYRPLAHAELIAPFDSFINDVFNANFPGLTKSFGEDFFVKGSYPKVNVLDLKNKVLIEAAIPGMDKSDITVDVKGDVLTISGQSNHGKDHSDATFVRRELKRSKFQRSFALGDTLDQSNIKASCSDGVLTLDIPKLIPEKTTVESRRINIS